MAWRMNEWLRPELVSQSGAGKKLTRTAVAVKMTTNDGTTKALLQRFIDNE
jgi:hypothetical protein